MERILKTGGIGGLTTTYYRIKELAPLIRKYSPNSLFVGGGGWSTYNPTEILELVPELDLIVIGEGEETFSELYDEVNNGGKDFHKINGLCIREKQVRNGHSFYSNTKICSKDA